ncbi:hypothetical protein [Desulfitobacterium metallireducens]|uniref:Uncharacterized protein n=1 Tax=Desulfitobacterium metallireducens DSM 15288 TaxID=871968 RepID=W0EFS6_9FIRM|nr:hypothetical protein [Desulfitobacterium metallireducens]AHF08363.1 hypothetical protein DESME_00755 [Desulfitobacterium metallireducens DSM 15288]
MNKEEFEKLDLDAQFKQLNAELEAGKNINDLLKELDLTKEVMVKKGFYAVGKKIMRKPVRGYNTPQD